MLQNMKEYIFSTSIWLPAPLEKVFQFFARAENLQKITPPWVHFELLTPKNFEICAGTHIDYNIRIHGVPVRWQTEIGVWEPPFRFVDIQIKGPYRLWHHTHTFEAHQEGTMCHDLVRYNPFGGALTNWLFVRRDVERIFDYRKHVLSELFR